MKIPETFSAQNFTAARGMKFETVRKKSFRVDRSRLFSFAGAPAGAERSNWVKYYPLLYNFSHSISSIHNQQSQSVFHFTCPHQSICTTRRTDCPYRYAFGVTFVCCPSWRTPLHPYIQLTVRETFPLFQNLCVSHGLQGGRVGKTGESRGGREEGGLRVARIISNGSFISVRRELGSGTRKREG